MNFFFTSDLHINHTNVIKYDDRPYQTVEQMNEDLIKKWNSVVKDGDIVYVLGDFGFCSLTLIKSTLDQMKGTKILILGNHDRHSVTGYYNAGFNLVVNEVTITSGKTIFRLSHYPYRQSKWKQWWEKIKTGKNYYHINRKRPTHGIEQWLLHGHTHSGSELINRKKKQIHVGVYHWDYKPVNIHQIQNLIYNGRT